MKKLYLLIIIALSFFPPLWGGKEGLFAQSQFQVALAEGGTMNDQAISIIQTTDGGYAVAGYHGSGFVNIDIVKLSLNGSLQWSKTGGVNGANYAYSIIQTSDGGYSAAGAVDSFNSGGNGMYIVKLASDCSLQWSKIVSGTHDDYARSIIQTTDGGYAVAGYTFSFGAGDDDMYIVKLSSNGSVQWSKTVGGTSYDEAYSIVQTTDGGYVVAGITESFGEGGEDIYIVKLSSNGSLQWSKTVGGTNNDAANSIVQTIDGGYAVAGQTYSFGAGSWDMYIVKLDATGSLQWSKTVGGTNNDAANSIVQTIDGGYAVAGSTSSFGAGFDDMYIVKLSPNGSLQWSRTIGGTIEDYAYFIIQTTDGGYAVAGYTNSFGAGGFDMYIVKLSSTGLLQWSRTVGGTNEDEAGSIIQTSNGSYVAAGGTVSFGLSNHVMYIVKLDVNGNTCANSTSPSSISGTGGTETSPTSTITTPTSTVTTPSPTFSTGGNISTICLVGIEPISTEIPKSFSLYQNYPNPFNPSTKIKYDIPSNVKGEMSNVKLVIYDVLGKEVATLVNEKQNAGIYEVTWDASNFPSGVYFYQLKAGSFTDTKKLVLIK